MATQADYRVAAEQTTVITSKGLRAGSRVARPGTLSPSGRHNSHAYIAGEDLALCGVGIGPLVLFPEFRYSHLNPYLQCVECREIFLALPSE